MKLLDIADVNPNDGTRWLQGYNAVGRECGVTIEFEEACEPDTIPVVGDMDSVPSEYKVVPFPVRGFLRRSTMCSADDDTTWFVAAFKAAMELVVSRALVIQAAAGAETWIGDTAAQNAATIAAARTLWFESVVNATGGPILHVPPSLAAGLVLSGHLNITGPEEVSSVWGDPVVIAPGYESGTPQVFFTGDIIVRLSGVDNEGGAQIIPRQNTQVVAVNEIGAIDVAPCSIVRVGA